MSEPLLIQPVSQRDSRWANIILGFSSTTIGGYGCTITCLTMFLNYLGLRITPAEVNQRLKDGGGYAAPASNPTQKNLLVWAKLPEIFTEVKLKFVYRHYSYDNAIVSAQIDKGFPVLVEVDFDGTDRQDDRHWVLYKGGQKMNDPWPVEPSERPTTAYKAIGCTILEGERVSMAEEMMQIAKSLFTKLVGNSTKWDQTVKYLELPTDPSTTSFEEVQRVIGGFKSRVTDLQNQLNTTKAELTNREEQVGRLKDQLLNEEKLRNELQIKLNSALKINGDTTGVYQGQITALQSQVDELAKAKGQLNIDLTAAQQSSKDWQTKYNDLLSTHTAAHITLADAVWILVKSFFGWAKNVQLKKTDDFDITKLQLPE